MKIAANKQALVEFAEYIAVTKGNARWALHSGLYLSYQTYLFGIIEYYDSFDILPFSFENQWLLLRWANRNKMAIEKVPGISIKEALSIRGTKHSPSLFNGVPILWVKANAKCYRKAMVSWIAKERGISSIGDYESAETFCSNIAEALEEKLIRKNISPSRRSTLVNEFKYLSEKFKSVHASGHATPHDQMLLNLLDRSLDADHVINKQSLINLEDAWVVLAPVISGTNRKFGRLVERYTVPFKKGRGRIPLDPITALKLHAATVPMTAAEINSAYNQLGQSFRYSKNVSRQIVSQHLLFHSLINRTTKTWMR